MNVIESLKKQKKAFSVSATATAISTAVFAVLTVVFFSISLYLWAWIMFFAAAASVYAAVFTAFSAYERDIMLKFVPLYSECGDDFAAIAEKLGWTEAAVQKYSEKCKKAKLI